MTDSPRTLWTIADAARAAVSDPALTRPDWVHGTPRNPALLWLDKNENSDPELARVTARVVSEVLAGPSGKALFTYPDSTALYRKLADHEGCKPTQLMLAAGSDGVIRSVFEAFVNPGDLVVHTYPTFAMYPVYSRMYSARTSALTYARTNGGPALSLDTVLSRVKELRPKLLCLPNPDSPTGTVFNPDALGRVIDACLATGTVILVDEAYYPFYGDTVSARIATAPNLVVARTFAKAWGLAGLRIGYAMAHEKTAAILHKVRPMYETNTVAVAVMERMLDFAGEVDASVRRLNAGRDGFLDVMETLNLPTVRARGNFLHVAFGPFACAVHDTLADLVLYRLDGGEECLRGYSRFSATSAQLFAPIIERIARVVSHSSGALRGGVHA